MTPCYREADRLAGVRLVSSNWAFPLRYMVSFVCYMVESDSRLSGLLAVVIVLVLFCLPERLFRFRTPPMTIPTSTARLPRLRLIIGDRCHYRQPPPRTVLSSREGFTTNLGFILTIYVTKTPRPFLQWRQEQLILDLENLE